jgi:hypothetical protein
VRETLSSLLLKLFAASLLLPTLAVVGPPAQDARSGAQEVRIRDCDLLIQSRKFDEYGEMSAEEETARLEKLVAALKAESKDTKAFIIGYAGRAGRAGDGIKRADSARQILTEKPFEYSLHNTRLNTLDCGRRETAATELWITPVGASPPRCSPTLDPAPAPAKGGAVPRRTRRRSGRL